MIRRLRIKFICITMVILTVMMSVLLVSQFNTTRSSLTQSNLEALETAARDFLHLEPEMDRPDRPDMLMPERPDREKPGAPHPCFVLTMDLAGSLTAAGSGFFDLTDRQMLLDIYNLAEEREENSGLLWRYALRYLRIDSWGTRYYVFTDVAEEMETLQQMGRNAAVIWIVGIFCFLGLSIFLANWAIRPVERAWEQQRQFVADASHELKTPLTVILTNAELLRESVSTDRQRQFSDSILTMSGQMRGLVERMLQLARADSGAAASEREKLDWSGLLEQTILPFEPVYFEAGLTLDSAIRPGVTLTGNAAQLQQVAEILLENALKYASPGGTVRVVLEQRGHHCCLSVASPGETLTPQQCRDIFKRFYRTDPARRRNGSYGLGLAIAERVVSDHRGRIWAEGRDGVNTFYVNLPAG